MVIMRTDNETSQLVAFVWIHNNIFFLVVLLQICLVWQHWYIAHALYRSFIETRNALGFTFVYFKPLICGNGEMIKTIIISIIVISGEKSIV